MISETDFDVLLDSMYTFSPVVEDADLLPVADPSPSPFLPPPSSSPTTIRVTSMNTMRSNVVSHILLSSSSLPRSDLDSSIPVTDIILIQEPWFGKIGTDIASGKGIIGPVAHPDRKSVV